MADSDRTWKGLVPMDDADVEMAENEPDPRGWDVVSADGRKIGEVDELLVDTEAMKVRYLDVDVDEDELDLDDADRRLMIPMRSVELDEDDEKVIVSGFDSARIAGLHGRVDLAQESFGSTVRDDAAERARFGAGDTMAGGPTFERDAHELNELRESEPITERGAIMRGHDALGGDVGARPVENTDALGATSRRVDRDELGDTGAYGTTSRGLDESDFVDTGDVGSFGPASGGLDRDVRDRGQDRRRPVVREELVLRRRTLTRRRDYDPDEPTLTRERIVDDDRNA